MSDGRPLRMGTRASLLARTQSGHVAAALTKATGRAVEEVLVRTEGDQLSTEGRIPAGGDSVGRLRRAPSTTRSAGTRSTSPSTR